MVRGAALAAFLALAAATAGCADDVDDRPATFEYVWAAVLRPSCATSGCHSELSATYGLRLDQLEIAYFDLVGSACEDAGPDAGPDEAPGNAPRNFVAPGHPEYSELMYVLRGENRRRMPLDAPLADPDIALIERWILEGAPCR